jgi:hypothetical protein
MADKPDKFWQTANFKKLQDRWTKKLEDSGFVDIEQPEHFKSGVPDGALKTWVGRKYSKPSAPDIETLQEREEYYRLAGQFLWSHKFSSGAERLIWELHSNGKSIRNIVKELKTKNHRRMEGRLVNKRLVHETVQRLVKTMKETFRSE